jgi:hypothetical protein
VTAASLGGESNGQSSGGPDTHAVYGGGGFHTITHGVASLGQLITQRTMEA